VETLCDGFVKLGFASDLTQLRTIDARSRQMFEIMLDSLEASQLVRGTRGPDRVLYGLTFRGRSFVRACRPPEPKVKGEHD
jgi:hypothetical protein